MLQESERRRVNELMNENGFDGENEVMLDGKATIYVFTSYVLIGTSSFS